LGVLWVILVKNGDLPKGEFHRNMVVLAKVSLERFLRNRVEFLSGVAQKATDILIFPIHSVSALTCQPHTSLCKCPT